MTATQMHKAVARSSVGEGPAIMKAKKGFNWLKWIREQKRNPIQFTTRKGPSK